MSWCNRPILYESVHIFGFIDQPSRCHSTQLRRLGPFHVSCWSIRHFSRVTFILSIVCVGVVRDHVFKRCYIAPFLASWNCIDSLELDYVLRSGIHILQLRLIKVALMSNPLDILRFDLTANESGHSTVVDLVRTTETITLCALLSSIPVFRQLLGPVKW